MQILGSEDQTKESEEAKRRDVTAVRGRCLHFYYLDELEDSPS